MDDTTHLPELAVRRAILKDKRDRARAAAFAAEIEREGVRAQVVDITAEDRATVEKELAATIANCRASATRFDELLKALPDSEATP